MTTFKKMFLYYFLLMLLIAQAHAGLINNQKGFWITPKTLPQNLLIAKSGEVFTFEGDVCVVKWNNIGHDQCLKIPTSKVVFKAYYPDTLHDVTDQLVVTQSENQKTWKYKFKTGSLKDVDLNQFTLTVGSSSQKGDELLKVKAKFEKRILILKEFRNQYAGKSRNHKNVTYLSDLIKYLELLVTRIDLALDNNSEILAQIRQPLQVNNKISGPMIYTSNFSGHKITLKIPVGVPFEGEKTAIESTVTNLSNKSFYFPEFSDDDENKNKNGKGNENDVITGEQSYKLSIELDGHILIQTQPFSLDFGQSKTIAAQTGKLNPHFANKIKTHLERSVTGKFDFYSFLTRRLGSLSYDLNVVEDDIAPEILNVKPTANSYHKTLPEIEAVIKDLKGRIDFNTIKVSFKGTKVDGAAVEKDLTSSFLIDNQGANDNYLLKGNSGIFEEGVYELSFSGKDYAENEVTKLISNVVYDSTAPVIDLQSFDNRLTNNPTFKISATTFDFNPGQTRVVQNGQVVFTTNDIIIDYDAQLEEGLNIFEIESVDLAGNVASKKGLYNIVLDTVAPSISNILPNNDTTIYDLSFLFSGMANEDLSLVKINDVATVFNKNSFTKQITTPTEGHFPVTLQIVDKAGNVSTFNYAYNIVLKIFIRELLSITPDRLGEKLVVRGLENIAKPGTNIRMVTNAGQTKEIEIVHHEGFEFTFDPFTSLAVTASNPSTGSTEVYKIDFAADTTLSGVVKDSLADTPLAGAKVTIEGTEIQTVTNGSGVFSFSNPPSGVQKLQIDGSTIPLEVSGPNKKFSFTTIAVNIGKLLPNPIEKTIFLTPLVFDGSEVSIEPNARTIASFSNAPGVELDISESTSVVFPNGQQTGVINAVEVPVERSTISPPEFVSPSSVIVFEPSGLRFSKPVDITLPNQNELMADTQVVFLSKNSEKGIWEIDGAGRVTQDGQSIVSESGQGITHFSEVIAIPQGLSVNEFGKPEMELATDLSRTIKTTEVKYLGEQIGLNFIYKSKWSSPSRIISNVLDIPKSEIKVSFDSLKRYRGVQINSKESITSWVVPEKISAKFHMNGQTSNEISYAGEIPNKSIVSYMLDLKNTQSGIHNYFAKYFVKLKNMVIGTRDVGYIFKGERTLISQNSFEESREIEKILPSDFVGNVYVQNKVQSKFGSGLKLEGSMEIINPNGENRILLEDGTGEVKNFLKYIPPEEKVKILYQASSNEGVVGVKTFPNIYVFNSKNNNIKKIDATSLTVLREKATKYFDGKIVNFARKYPSCKMSATPAQYPLFFNRSAKVGNTDLLVMNNSLYTFDDDLDLFLGTENNLTPNGFGEYSEVGFSNKTASNIDTQIASFVSSVSNECTRLNLNNCSIGSTTYKYLNGTDCTSFNVNHISRNIYTPSELETYPNLQKSAFGKYPDMTVMRAPISGTSPTSNVIAGSGIYTGKLFSIDRTQNVIRISDQAKAELPKGYSMNPEVGRRLKYSNMVLIYSFVNFAGNGSNTEDGDGIATSKGIPLPTSLAIDKNNNVLIINDNGYVKKVNTANNISTIGGKKLDEGGIIASSSALSSTFFNKPQDIVYDTQKDVFYIADTGNHRVVEIDINHNSAKTIAGTMECGSDVDVKNPYGLSLCSPNELAISQNGNLLIYDSGKQRILEISTKTGNSPGGDSNQFVEEKGLALLVKKPNSTFELKLRNGDVANFDNEGRQLNLLSKNGKAIQFRYEDDFLKGILINGNEIFNLEYNDGLLESVRDVAGRVTTFEHVNRNLVSVNKADDSTIKFNYFNNGLMSAFINERGKPTHFAYNGFNKLVSTTAPDGSIQKIDDSLIKTTGNNFINGNLGNLKSTTKDELTDRVVDSKGSVTESVRNEMGYISYVKDAEGRTTEIQRNYEGQPIRIKRPDNSVIDFEYDEETLELIKKEDSSSGVETRYVYNDNGLILRMYENNLLAIENVYNEFNELVSKTNRLNQKITYEYNSLGLITRETSPGGGTTNFEFDTQGNIYSTKDGEGNIVTTVRDLAGNILRSINNENQTVKYTYDELNRLLSVESPLGEMTNYVYSPTGKTSQVKDSKNKLSTYVYNDVDLLIESKDASGRITELDYDSNGNLTREIDSTGKITNYEYDKFDRVVKKILPDNLYEYSYDSRDNLKSIKNNINKIEIEYVSLVSGDKISHASSVASGSRTDLPSYDLEYGYDLRGNRTNLKINGESLAQFQYDNGDRLIRVINQENKVFDYAYDSNNRIAEINRPGSSTGYSYFSNDVLSQIVHKPSLGTELKTQYFVNGLGYISKKRSPAGDYDYGYDNNNQLKTATNPESLISESYSYDSLGNRLSDQSGIYSYDQDSQLLKEDYRYTYIFDGSGNLSSKVNKISNVISNYIYNSEDKLIGIKDYNSQSQLIKEIHYSYDAIGRRIEKQIIDFQNSENSKLHRYVYDGDELLLVLNESNEPIMKYTHSGSRTDDVLAVTDLTANKVYYFLKDHQGSITDIVDENGNVKQHYTYSSFGEIQKITDKDGNSIAPVIENHFAFTGREYDAESELYYYRARYYDPKAGRFLQVDPHPGYMVNPITHVNKYIYTKNNPANLIDPKGKFGFLAAAGASLVFTGIISVIQTEIQSKLGKGKWSDNFWKNWTINFGISMIGLTAHGMMSGFNSNYALGWGGVYSKSAYPGARGFSLGFFQSAPRMGNQLYWHEVGHTINFALLGSLQGGKSWETRVGWAGAFYAIHGIGSLGGRWNAATYATEGSADLWSSGNFGFEETKTYEGPIGPLFQ